MSLQGIIGTKEAYSLLGTDEYDRVIEVIEKIKDEVSISIMFTRLPYDDFINSKENYGFLLLCDEWQNNNCQLKCYSI
ncbi:MAG: hypothetical protein JKY54_01870, partial [Flavobacteriales bacterium]|nr:hypothetical protein [Flavobacteriales bacterium]